MVNESSARSTFIWKALCLFAIGVGAAFVFFSRLPGRGDLVWQLQQADLSDPVTVISGILAILATLELVNLIRGLPDPRSAIPASKAPQEKDLPAQKSTKPGETVGTAAFGGMVAGAAAHYFGGGKLTFPIFIVAYFLISSLSKPSGRLLRLLVFVAGASLALVVLHATVR